MYIYGTCIARGHCVHVHVLQVTISGCAGDASDLLDLPSNLGHNRTASSISRGSSGSVKGVSRVRLTSSGPDCSKDLAKPKRILFVERLIDIVNHSLPNFCKLGQAYFQRTLFTVSEWIM